MSFDGRIVAGGSGLVKAGVAPAFGGFGLDDPRSAVGSAAKRIKGVEWALVARPIARSP